MGKRNRGLAAALASYLLWGLLPIYWKQLSAASAYEILAHRIIWSFFFMLIVLALLGRLAAFREECKSLWENKSRGALLATASLLISANWCIFIWAVTNHHVVDTSVGYYMNPLVSVLLGVVVFRERLSKLKWFAIFIAFAGLAYMTWQLGRLPFIAVGLAATFALYGAVKKKLKLDAFYSITLETFFVLPAAVAYVFMLDGAGASHFGASDMRTTAFLIGAGAATATPLVLFSMGANSLPLNVLGFCQYIAPSITLLLGIFLFGESLSYGQMTGISFIWLALAVFTIADWRERAYLEKHGRFERGKRYDG